jgi:peptidoglycan/LPS O-acetylase OafA/YrhL
MLRRKTFTAFEAALAFLLVYVAGRREGERRGSMTFLLKVLSLLLLLAGCLALLYETEGIATEVAAWLSGHHLQRLAGGVVLLVMGGAFLVQVVLREADGR